MPFVEVPGILISNFLERLKKNAGNMEYRKSKPQKRCVMVLLLLLDVMDSSNKGGARNLTNSSLFWRRKKNTISKTMQIFPIDNKY